MLCEKSGAASGNPFLGKKKREGAWDEFQSAVADFVVKLRRTSVLELNHNWLPLTFNLNDVVFLSLFSV